MVTDNLLKRLSRWRSAVSTALSDNTISRRQLMKVSGGLVLAASIPVFRGQAATPSEIMVDDATTLSYLDNAAWIPQGRPSDKQAYVVAAPWCPYCQALYKAAGTAKLDVQLRWVMAYPRDAQSEAKNRYAAITRSTEALDHTYKTGAPLPNLPDDARWLAAWNDGVRLALQPRENARIAGTGAGYGATPSVYWPTADGLALRTGFNPGDIQKLFQGIVARPEAKDIVPIATTFSGTVTAERQLSMMLCTQKGTTLRAVPSLAAPAIQTLPPQSCLSGNKIAETSADGRWVYMPYAHEGQATIGGWAPLEAMVTQNGTRPNI